MSNSVVRAIFENGLFRPLDPVEITNREQVTLRIARPERVRASSGILAITDFELVRDVAESEEYSILA